MVTISIQNPDKFIIADEITADIYHGCDQEWYKTKWQRMAGCGPTVATNILSYLTRSQSAAASNSPLAKSDCLTLMEDVWQYVTPTLRGVNTTKLLYDGVLDYAKDKGLNVRFDYINISKIKKHRPDFTQLLTFLDDCLKNDLPIAFLNLNNGEEKGLDSWHWVTMISLEYEEDGSAAFIEFLDEGKVKRIDLSNWFKTTTLGGGFVSFSLSRKGDA